MKAVTYYERRAEEGAGVGTVAQEIGLSTQSLSRWLEEAKRRRQTYEARQKELRQPTRAAPVFRSVQVERPVERGGSAGGGIVLHGPGELRIEGLAVAELVELLRALQ